MWFVGLKVNNSLWFIRFICKIKLGRKEHGEEETDAENGSDTLVINV